MKTNRSPQEKNGVPAWGWEKIKAHCNCVQFPKQQSSFQKSLETKLRGPTGKVEETPTAHVGTECQEEDTSHD